jgi:hypothetical protein
MTQPQWMLLDAERPGETYSELILNPGRLPDETLCWPLILGTVEAHEREQVDGCSLTDNDMLNLAMHGL